MLRYVLRWHFLLLFIVLRCVLRVTFQAERVCIFCVHISCLKQKFESAFHCRMVFSLKLPLLDQKFWLKSCSGITIIISIIFLNHILPRCYFWKNQAPFWGPSEKLGPILRTIWKIRPHPEDHLKNQAPFWGQPEQFLKMKGWWVRGCLSSIYFLRLQSLIVILCLFNLES